MSVAERGGGGAGGGGEAEMRVRVEERTGERVEEKLVSFVFSFTGVFGTHRVCAI